MTPLLSDESLNAKIITGLRQRVPHCDLITVREADLRSKDDRSILEWAAARGRLVVASDKRTMIGFAYDRVRAGAPMPGLIIISQDLPVGDAIAAMELVSQYLLPGEWENQVKHLPLRE